MRISATGNYTVADDQLAIDENGYDATVVADGKSDERRLNRSEFATAPHGAAIALLGSARGGYTPVLVGACVLVTPAMTGSLRVGVNDRDVRNNTGQLTFSVEVMPPPTDRWSAGAISPCGAPNGKSPPF